VNSIQDLQAWSRVYTDAASHDAVNPTKVGVHVFTAILERSSINLDDRALKDGLERLDCTFADVL